MLKEIRQIKPLRDVVFVIQEPNNERTENGIIILGTASEKPALGKVAYVGPGRSGDPMALKPGDMITFPKMAGAEIELNNIKYLILKEEDVLCIN